MSVHDLAENGPVDTGPESELSDKTIECIDCSEVFVWSIGEQQFYAEKGLAHPPKRCKACKKAKNRRLALVERAKLNGKPAVMKITAVCARCDQETTIPFYPSQGRPVYCRACFVAAKAEAEVGAAAGG